MEMGNASVFRRDEGGPSGAKTEEEEEGEEEYMEYAHVSYHAPAPFPECMVQSPPHSPRAYHSPLLFTPQVSVTPLQRPDAIQIQSDEPKQNAMFSEKRIPTSITWSHDGKQVAIEGSWDNWKTREFLQRSGRDLAIIKVLPSGIYHYRFIVDGQWRCAPDLPQKRDYMGNIFNILDLQEYIPEIHENILESESPPRLSSYNNASFSLEDFNEKVPELPPLLLRTPLDAPSSLDNPLSLENPLSGILNHFYIYKPPSGESMAALSSTQRFRKKYVTTVLYKSLKKLKS